MSGVLTTIATSRTTATTTTTTTTSTSTGASIGRPATVAGATHFRSQIKIGALFVSDPMCYAEV